MKVNSQNIYGRYSDPAFETEKCSLNNSYNILYKPQSSVFLKIKKNVLCLEFGG